MGWRLPGWRCHRGLRIVSWRRAIVAWVQGNTGSFAGVLASAGLGLTIALELVEWMGAQQPVERMAAGARHWRVRASWAAAIAHFFR